MVGTRRHKGTKAQRKPASKIRLMPAFFVPMCPQDTCPYLRKCVLSRLVARTELLFPTLFVCGFVVMFPKRRRLGKRAVRNNIRRLSECCMKRHPEMLLSQHELAAAYAKTLRFVTMSRRLIPSDETRQHMADAVREFYELLEAKIE